MTDLQYLPWRRPAEYDEGPCVQDDQHALTHAEFGAWVDAVAEQYTERGVALGTVVAIMLPNRVELLVAMVAAWRVGAAATPINPVFTANEADYQIQRCRCRARRQRRTRRARTADGRPSRSTTCGA